jgi:hypothetical protein
MRRIIEYTPKELDEKIKDGDKTWDDRLADYLNFFEFIGTLLKMKQLSLNEIRMVFECYIKSIEKDSFLIDYIKKNGFENLDALIEQLK